ncbi:hypothetical protein ABVT39_001819, partial [Epinephelus coioides]
MNTILSDKFKFREMFRNNTKPADGRDLNTITSIILLLRPASLLRRPQQRVIHLDHLKGGDRGQVEEEEEEEVQTAAGFTPR